MKLLKIENNCGAYMDKEGNYIQIDKIRKEDLLQLVDWTLESENVEWDAFDEELIKHQAHQIIYKNIAQKLVELKERRKEFCDESARLFLTEYDKYSSGTCE